MGDILKPVIEFDGARVFHGSCLDILPTLADNSVDAVVCDPPYELGFMGKKWDSSGVAFNVAVWEQCLRVLKPGGHLLAFGGSRTWHRLAVAIEDAGFELRDSIAWLYGSGFPKSLDVSKAIDKAAGVEREVVGSKITRIPGGNTFAQDEWTQNARAISEVDITAPATTEAQQWQGWGTALKPAFEPVVVARKPVEGTVANNVLVWGVGGLNIDGTRIGTTVETWPATRNYSAKEMSRPGSTQADDAEKQETGPAPAGRWPSNVMLDEYTAALVDEQSGVSVSKSGGISSRETAAVYGKHKSTPRGGHDDSGGASRFFYVAKASKRDRNEGLDDLDAQRHSDRIKDDGIGGDNPRNRSNQAKQNFHPTVKPTDLMRQLVRLVTPPGGIVLDPFTGSGSTGKAALLEGFDFIGCELTEDYLPIIEGRLRYAIETVKAEQQAESERKNETLF